MTGNPCWQAIPTKLSETQFEEFVLPHLSRGRRGPAPTLSLHKIFNYILQILYMGCQPFSTALFGRLGVLVVRTQLDFFNAPRLTKCIPLIDQVGDSAAFLSL
jgi:hypothetical protein